MTWTFLIDALVTVIGITTPILLAASGELVVEKSGVINLGIEGMMLVGAITGFAVAFEFGDPWIGIAAAALAGVATSIDFRGACFVLGYQSGCDRFGFNNIRYRVVVARRYKLYRLCGTAF